MIAHFRQHQRTERGQIVVIFAVVLVTIIVMVGLVLDGGSAFAQRRSQQNASDLAALAGANTYLLTNDTNAATTAAQTVAAENGWDYAAADVTVTVTVDTSNGAAVTVEVGAPHHNNFGAVVGMTNWAVGTTATALAGFPDTAFGAAPFIFSIDAFQQGQGPHSLYGNPNAPFGFGGINDDIPDGPGDFAWTNYGTGNVNTDDVEDMINGSLVIDKTIQFGEYIGQHNNGNHTALYQDVEDNMEGQAFPVPVVDHGGNFMGWATFRVVDSDKGDKKIYGYFESPFINQRLSVGNCAAGACPSFLGSYVLKLVD